MHDMSGNHFKKLVAKRKQILQVLSKNIPDSQRVVMEKALAVIDSQLSESKKWLEITQESYINNIKDKASEISRIERLDREKALKKQKRAKLKRPKANHTNTVQVLINIGVILSMILITLVAYAMFNGWRFSGNFWNINNW